MAVFVPLTFVPRMVMVVRAVIARVRVFMSMGIAAVLMGMLVLMIVLVRMSVRMGMRMRRVLMRMQMRVLMSMVMGMDVPVFMISLHSRLTFRCI